MKKGSNPHPPTGVRPPAPPAPPEPGAKETPDELKERLQKDHLILPERMPASHIVYPQGSQLELQIEQTCPLARIATALERLLDGELVIHTRGWR